MFRLIVNRILMAIPTLILVSMMIFGLQKMLPGDPVLAMAGEDQNPQVIAALRLKYHLDEPVPTQYLLWMKDLLHGNLGASLRTDVPVTELIAQKLPVTLQLAVMGMIIAIAIGLPAGILAAANKGRMLDYGSNILALSGMSIPNFWLGLILIFVVSVRWHLLPSSGYVAPSEDFWLSIKTMLMPAFVLGAALGAQLMRHTRSAMLSVLQADYIRTARDRGGQARISQCLDADCYGAGAVIWRTAGRCGADRASVYHSWFRQAGSGLRVQPRLRCGTRRGARHSAQFHGGEPACGRALYLA